MNFIPLIFLSNNLIPPAIHGDYALEPLGILSVSVYVVSNFVTINNSEQHPYMYDCVAEVEL